MNDDRADRMAAARAAVHEAVEAEPLVFVLAAIVAVAARRFVAACHAIEAAEPRDLLAAMIEQDAALCDLIAAVEDFDPADIVDATVVDIVDPDGRL